jgi:hypothetical protein
MEYLLGAAMTLLSLFVIRLFLSKGDLKKSIPTAVFSQSRIFTMMNPYLNTQVYSIPPVSQSSKYEESQRIPVIMSNNKAYWILHSTFYEADQVNGEIIKESTKPVDIMGMDKVQLRNMMFIVEQLTEGKRDEDWNSGK